jgi:hypothetical protein
MPQYMLLLHESTTAPDLGPDEIQAIIARYVAWSDAMRARGALVAGEKLRDRKGRVLRREGGRVLARDGFFAEAKEVIGGYYVLAARDDDEAEELARTCPHLELGGTIELREIEEV